MFMFFQRRGPEEVAGVYKDGQHWYHFFCPLRFWKANFSKEIWKTNTLQILSYIFAAGALK